MIVYMFNTGSEPGQIEVSSLQLLRLQKEMIKFLKYQHGADETDAMDATKETLYILFKMWKKNDFEHIKAQKAYMFKILRNQYFKILRDRSMYVQEPIDPYLEKIASHQMDDFIEKENAQLLADCISKLSSKH